FEESPVPAFSRKTALGALLQVVPAATVLPSEEKATQRTPPSGFLGFRTSFIRYRCVCLREATSQSRTSPSFMRSSRFFSLGSNLALPETSSLPSRLKATPYTSPPWPIREG